jgi:hypothetical protein
VGIEIDVPDSPRLPVGEVPGYHDVAEKIALDLLQPFDRNAVLLRNFMPVLANAGPDFVIM